MKNNWKKWHHKNAYILLKIKIWPPKDAFEYIKKCYRSHYTIPYLHVIVVNYYNRYF